MTTYKHDFKGDDYDFALGSVKGIRSWQIDGKGRLRGITHPAVWLPGENVATCRTRPRCPARAVGGGPNFFYDRPTLGPRALDTKACKVDGCDGKTHPPTHTFDADCECGFWAYDEVAFKPHGQVTGVIEGYGRTTIGTKGFRCEKAKVVGLARENDDGILTLSEWLRLKQLYPAASFYDDVDDMVIAHGAVMKNWDAVDDDFWIEEPDDDPASAVLNSYQAQLAALQAQVFARAASQSFSRGHLGIWSQP